MYEKLENLNRIVSSGIIAVVRAKSAEQALKIAEACKVGGIEVIEITMTVPNAADVIKEIVKAYPNKEILVGAGTVLDPETARVGLFAGAEFIVSPNISEDTIKLVHRYGKIVMPGTYTITEIIRAMELGGDIIKYFPGSLGGITGIKAISGPLPQVPFCPTGGVSLETVADWIKAGVVAVGVGSELTKGAKSGNYEGITATAREFVARIKAARQIIKGGD
ncbi:MAG: bifunctional 2-keto-4-hydroxyglutarate aldolase/2-keto-3-deoxy-6-phosphogluconate aldolase [Bacillota bacterium]